MHVTVTLCPKRSQMFHVDIVTVRRLSRAFSVASLLSRGVCDFASQHTGSFAISATFGGVTTAIIRSALAVSDGQAVA